MRRTLLALPALALVAGVLPQSAQAATPGPVTTLNASPPKTGRCAKVTNHSIKGSIQGEDGNAVNVTIGFDLVDSKGRKIDLRTGCLIGNAYSSLVELNHYLTQDGAPFGTVQMDKKGNPQGEVRGSFVLAHLPANASHIYAESYPRAATHPNCQPYVYKGVNRATDSGITTGCAGDVVKTKYGSALRRFAKTSATLTMVQPLTPAYGGTTGSIVVTGSVARVYARSDAPDGTRLMGWGTGHKDGSTVVVDALASGQTYTVESTLTSGRVVVRHGVKVNNGKVTRINAG